MWVLQQPQAVRSQSRDFHGSCMRSQSRDFHEGPSGALLIPWLCRTAGGCKPEAPGRARLNQEHHFHIQQSLEQQDEFERVPQSFRRHLVPMNRLPLSPEPIKPCGNDHLDNHKPVVSIPRDLQSWWERWGCSFIGMIKCLQRENTICIPPRLLLYSES